KQIPKEFVSQYPNVAWKQAAGIRDVLIHDYSEVNLKRVWNTINQDLPELKMEIRSIRDSLK
ncbi:MAG: HepT-like ribonuclease domain-containing protein, partial [Patescibacteria group bacterium]